MIRESVLDDFAGLGDVRRAALMAHFGGIDRLRAATADEIQEVDGFGPKLAAELHAFLHRPENTSSSSSDAEPEMEELSADPESSEDLKSEPELLAAAEDGAPPSPPELRPPPLLNEPRPDKDAAG